MLTAAHCLFHPRTGLAVPLERPALRSRRPAAPRRRRPAKVARRGDRARASRWSRRRGAEDLRADIALLELEAPVDPDVATPFATGPLLREDAAAADRLLRPRPRRGRRRSTPACPPLGMIAEVLVIACAIERGVSGAPVLAGDGPQTRVVAVVSSMGRMPGGEEFALAVAVAPWIEALEAGLAEPWPRTFRSSSGGVLKRRAADPRILRVRRRRAGRAQLTGPVPKGRPVPVSLLGGCTMRHFDLTPLYRSTVGFDRLATVLDQVMSADAGQNGYPPYNIEKTGDDAYRITIAVAGFAEDELCIETREGQLVVTGRKAETEDQARLPAPRHRDARLRAPLPARRPRARRERGDRERPAAHRPGARGARGAEAAPDRDRRRGAIEGRRRRAGRPRHGRAHGRGREGPP